MIIDSHIHISETGYWLTGEPMPCIKDIIHSLDNAGIDKAVVLSIPRLNNNIALYESLAKHNDRFIPFACINQIDNPKELRHLVNEIGFRGLKIHPRLQNIAPLDPKLFPIYEEAISLSIPIVFDCYPQSTMIPIEKLQPYEYDKIAKLFPTLKIVLAHAGGHRLWDAYFVAKSNSNVYLDISYISTSLRNTSLINDLKVMINSLDQKIIYGSDYPSIGIEESLSLAFTMTRDLQEGKKENIYSGNILKLINKR